MARSKAERSGVPVFGGHAVESAVAEPCKGRRLIASTLSRYCFIFPFGETPEVRESEAGPAWLRSQAMWAPKERLLASKA